ncbi:MAG: hypothetical protein QXL15_02305, partial [Candidatus Korarchaeota archaeon]
ELRDDFIWAINNFIAERPHVEQVFLQSRIAESKFEVIKKIYQDALAKHKEAISKDEYDGE